MTRRAVVVIGAGVVGLSAALVLAARGRSVSIVAEDPSGGDSAVAAALWALPFVEQSERVRGWAYHTLAMLRRDASEQSGVREQECRVMGMRPATPDAWTRSVTPPLRALDADELAPGTREGSLSSLPLIDTSRYLPWLRQRCVEAGIPVRQRRVHAIADVVAPDDVAVLAAGLGSGALAGDDTVAPVRTQIVRLHNPGLRRTTIVRDGAFGPLFVVARFDDVVIGGAAEAGRFDPAASGPDTAELVERARGIEPALRDAAVLSSAVGHRPVRPTLRLEADRIEDRHVVHCYGHGGAGVALSWGTAESAADLVEQL